MEKRETRNSRALLIGASCAQSAVYNSDAASFRELASLVETAGGAVFATLLQNRQSPDPATYIGEGKVEEARALIAANEIDLVVFDGELSPSQLQNLETALDCFVIDRSMLILDIFALHAVTSEGKLQVELAQLKYTLPRLTGRGAELSRLGAGIGTRGPGESKLELDRRHIRARIAALRKELDVVKKNRAQQRKSRDQSGCPRVGIIGYTNAGKSTLLNTLTGAGVLSQDKLFATLDPTTRKLTLEGGFEMLLTDTVGFIRNLPHHLIEAFSSTLDEVRYSDLLLQVVDVSNPEFAAQMEVVEKLVAELGGGAIPMVVALNKADLVSTSDLPYTRDAVAISARDGTGLDQLLQRCYEKLTEGMHRMTVRIPYDKGGLLERIHSAAQVSSEEYGADGILVTLTADDALYGQLRPYSISE